MSYLTIIGACYVIAGVIGMVHRTMKKERKAWRIHFDRHSMTEISIGAVHVMVDVALAGGGHAAAAA